MIWVAIITVIFGIILLITSIIKIEPYEKWVKERLVKYDSVLEPWYHFLVPLIDNVHKVDMRESKVTIWYNDIWLSETYAQYQIVISIQAIDPVLALYEKQNYLNELQNSLASVFLKFIEQWDIKNTFKDKQSLEEILWEKLRLKTKEWWIKINNVKITDNTETTKHDAKNTSKSSAVSLDWK